MKGYSSGIRPYMLTIEEYISICENKNIYILAAIIHDSKITISSPWPTVYSSLPAATERSIEIWLTDSKPTYSHEDNLHISFTDDLLFTSLTCSRSDLNLNAYSIYKALIKISKDYEKPNIIRMWNEIPQINQNDNDIERYKSFCYGRSQAFEEEKFQGSDFPAASALGSQFNNNNVNVYFISANTAGRTIENPNQVSAFEYPKQYGIRAPSFCRASLLSLNNKKMLFVSGTASIVGHKTIHIGNIIEQTHQSLRNIKVLMDQAQDNAENAYSPQIQTSALKVYLRNKKDYKSVKAILDEYAIKEKNTLYIQADICRSDLLVEIEAFFEDSIQKGDEYEL